ncbi:uncharacterized protein LOC106058759 [Biomphalaria glabrata]|uniref:Uncharacterized protein LOC106058759 n=1 Tax=Biomphalaria glabrata TaxID=6526 RepID=A0A9W3AFV4_BIOGL|nr:uncharacterized protein LOC106058759 [Biomphalaria glabrata]XP_055886049.1 uncharacterized protein LOC106058759 [Biomphalaria glabrata]XP_055886050.1 uncharacterized protein LOC106058759 [Biomphalaria glabrata]XP_055886051.1 uncharacterized protein LOC106058759 [Biomphalaria glabrata]XP_055886052.1 uncharacterized protein LOC106058759 [Biomphalaria glabrata]
MSKGPKIHEIFSNAGKNIAFTYENQETKQQIQLSKKKNAVSGPGMKKFGGYKPKILSGQNDFLSLQNDTPNVSLGLSGNSVSRTNQTLTKPKPWVIGDKNVPMVLAPLSSEEDNDSVDVNGNNHDNGHINDAPNDFGHLYNDQMRDVENSMRTQNIHSDTSTLISYSSDHDQGVDNPAASLMSIVDTLNAGEAPEKPPHINGKHHHPTVDLSHSNSVDVHVSEEVFIPAPDYDEEERTLDFTSEDTDDPDSPEGGQRNPKARPLSKVYDGEDFSQYLSDDDDNNVELRQKSNKNTLTRKSTSEAAKPKLNQKHLMFKQNTLGKNKRHSSGSVPGFNSVRHFSYADSKFGTKGRNTSKSMAFTELTDEGDVFLSANSQQGSYESFLRSRNGDVIPHRETSDSGLDMVEDGHLAHQRNKGDTLWKKMTYRFKHKSSKVN